MGFIGTLVGFTVAGAFLRRMTTSSRSSNDDNDEIQIRRYAKCMFDNGVPEDEFDQIVNEIAPKMPRYSSHERKGATVRITFRSNTGLTKWTAQVGFAEHGVLTTDYWIDSENDNSILPRVFADRVAERLGPSLRSTDSESAPEETSDSSSQTSNGLTIRTLLLIFGAMLAPVLLLAGIPYFEQAIHQGQSKMPFSSQSVIGMSYEDAEKKLDDSGFTSVQTVAKGDLPWFMPIHFDDGKIAEIEVDNIEAFSQGDWFDSNINIVLYYHSHNP